MSRDKDSLPVFDGTVLGLASLLHDEAYTVEQLGVRLDRLRFRRLLVPPMLFILAITVAALFIYMLGRTADAEIGMLLWIFLMLILLIISITVWSVYRSTHRRFVKLEAELSRAVEVLRELVERIAQFEEFRKLPAIEKFVVELRLRAADRVINNSLVLLKQVPRHQSEI